MCISIKVWSLWCKILEQNYRNDLPLFNFFQRNLSKSTAIRIYRFEEKMLYWEVKNIVTVMYPQAWRTSIGSHSWHWVTSGGQWPSAMLTPNSAQAHKHLPSTWTRSAGKKDKWCDNSTKRQPMQNQNPYWYFMLVPISDYKS